MRRLLYPLGILTVLLFTNNSQAQFFGPFGSYYGSSYSQFGTSFSLTSYNFRSSNYLNINNGFPINNYYYSNQFAYRYPYNYIAPLPVIVRPVVVQPIQLQRGGGGLRAQLECAPGLHPSLMMDGVGLQTACGDF